MRSDVVIIAYETPVLLEKVRYPLVRLVKSFYLTTGCRSVHANSDIPNPKAHDNVFSNAYVSSLAGLNWVP
jgi:hypothetical protein